MDNKDLLGLELKSIMEEDSRDLKLSEQAINRIISSREKTWKDKLNDFLNKEIEIPLAPALVGFAALFVVTILPKNIFNDENIKIINIDSSQIIIRDGKEVGRK